ncbi:hypothetical protein BDV25DRAFT_141000 [Aspergillus avenaceus]|uniref:Uncharacterized protein n=1 Tax=Aspergillus avenaceus TaxID=36643 RepID=A0A5N6TSA1_ASPAV|nr:hypothetical protein BDV25DRAFT_141000 [Aspergillus avenaceus]
MASDPSWGTNRRRQAFSFSIALRPSIARRARIVRAAAPPPTCEESVHYPVFDPHDPRHNPAIDTPLWDDGYYSPQEPGSRSPVGWIQSLPKRSLRKARSGLVALRSGLQRRAAVFCANRSSRKPRPWPLLDPTGDHHDGSFPSTVSEASTEEDSDFGTHLHRTECNDSSSLSHDLDKCLDNWPFAMTITDNPFQELTGGYCSPKMFLAETASSIFPRGPAEENVVGLPLNTAFPSEEYPPLDDYIMTRSDSEFEELHPEDSLSSRSLAEPEASYNAIINEITHSAVPSLRNTLFISPTVLLPSASSPQISGSPVHTTEPRNSEDITHKGLPGQAETREESQIASAEQSTVPMRPSDGLNRPSDRGMDANAIEQTLESTIRSHVPSPRAKSISSAKLSAKESTQARCSTESKKPATSNAVTQTVSQSVGSNTEPRTSGDTALLSDTQEPWSARPSEEATLTDLTSVSNTIGTPAENGDLISLLSFRDEYFLVDGKTRGHPDRGGNPVKAECSVVSEESMCIRSSLDRSSSVRSLDLPEIFGPGSYFS